MKIIVFIIVVLLCFCNLSSALSEKENIELQDQCGKQADVFFKAMYDPYRTIGETTVISKYHSHYNSKLNKCFIRIDDIHYDKRSMEIKEDNAYHLYDVNSHLDFGDCSKFSDSSQTKICWFLDENLVHINCGKLNYRWFAQINKYMSE